MKKNLNVTSVTLFLFLATSIITTNCGSIIKAQRNANTSITKLSLDTNVESDIGKGDFSIIRFCGDSLFLSLKQKTNTPVTILNTWQKKAVKVHVLETCKSTKLGNCVFGMYTWPDSVSYIGKFNNGNRFDLAILSDKNIKFLEIKINNDKNLINDLDKTIKSNPKLNYLFESDKVCPKINQKKLEYFEYNKNKYYIFSYVSASGSSSSDLAKFIIINNEIKLLSNSPNFKTFIYTTDNKQLFLGAWEGACGTEEYHLNLFEIKSSSFKLIYNGSRWEGSESNMDYINDLPPMPPMPEKGE